MKEKFPEIPHCGTSLPQIAFYVYSLIKAKEYDCSDLY